MNSRILALRERVLSESRLQDHDDNSTHCLEEGIISQSPRNIGREKSPALAMSNSSREFSMQWQDLIDEKHQGTTSENQPSYKIPKSCNDNFKPSQELKAMNGNPDSSELYWKRFTGTNEVTPNGKAMENKINCLPSISLPVRDLHDSGSSVFSLKIATMESSTGFMTEHLRVYQLDTTIPEFQVKSPNATKHEKSAMSERSQPVSSGSSGKLSVLSQKLMSAASNREGTIIDDNPKYYCNDGADKVFIRRQSSEGRNPRIALCAQPELSENKHKHNMLANQECINPSSDVKGDGRDVNESISDATMVEMEASIYGLQIIKDSDLEELQELGSGTFGTVYHGKWRGTDIAVKRIKKSCFLGKSSERERLIKDFWREAHILSNLHHPNVVAFYGVVPNGPGGTMATVAEYMVNGSLRHVLAKKDSSSLDRRKKLMITMDAAFGMEYLHMKDIVHFDLKCDNLLVNLTDPQRPICKVGDFGLSRIKRNTLVSGGVRGTLPWMAPELLNGSSNRVS